jgi:hypothetical protein
MLELGCRENSAVQHHFSGKEEDMAEAKRIKPQEARPKVQAGEALFVCGYDDEGMCGQMRLEGAMTFGEFNAKLPQIAKDKEIIFYCK